ncbi:hypothetical protein I2483_12000 [Sporosarcina sp. E16_3]|uniref:hypothetical protein n=1 Tax=Sporosarcina sp. E16_3 TaxID=2789293 RepID=UPI001A912ACC|nr:hypothetical protein [Sporosarcina sp. E16_3]MBO0602384.1 hypothetical protein [Sporosarcina sp. E16_3]
MLKIIDAIEVRACGVFKDTHSAKKFNQKIGDALQLHRLRTTLNLAEFKTTFFQLNADGAYLEKCCGIGNVKIKITKSPFHAVQGFASWNTERNKYVDLIEKIDNCEVWNKEIYKVSSLLSLREVENYAANPFKFIFIRNFGAVNKSNIDEFRKCFAESIVPIENNFYNFS